MSTLDARQLALRIDTVLDMLAGGDRQSAKHNLEILKAELLEHIADAQEGGKASPESPWEI